ncbi:hypothetical protein [Peptostreptococcus equinus]|uniref:DUF2232 domain-containing protein n=1 Tax=Peptostreptococcus equinus TaxID=3003601 RepID=A0ABY7JM90_9FIRM|nr:hypothetical protein [Peptostreptococcus sp. CBA3647]WAW14471.1 hypothetical protein O0R46_07670 [Peptostreptococcus sp. CBA3647]
MNKSKSQSLKVAFSGLILAINTIILLLVNIIETNTLALLALASFCSAIVLIEFGLKTSIVFSLASILLAFIVLTNKMYFFVYALSFGIYGCIKAIIEKNKNIKFQYVLKLLYANLVFILLYFISTKLLIMFDMKILYIIVYNFVFIIYDFIYSQFIEFYYNKIRKRLKIDNF